MASVMVPFFARNSAAPAEATGDAEQGKTKRWRCRHRFLGYGSMRSPNTTVADCPGASTPIVAVTVPAAPLAGATTEPTVVEAGTELE